MMTYYNSLANRRLSDSAACLTRDDDCIDLDGFFRSVHSTLNHLVVGGLLWLARFRRQAVPSFGLGDIPHDERKAA